MKILYGAAASASNVDTTTAEQAIPQTLRAAGDAQRAISGLLYYIRRAFE